MNLLSRLVWCALLAGSAAAVAGQVGGRFSTRPGTVPVPANVGQRLYEDKGCYQCHGLSGQGAIGVGPALHPGRLDAAGFASYVRGPSGQMPPYGRAILSARELTAIRAWLAGLPRSQPASTIPILKRYGVPASSSAAPAANPMGGRPAATIASTALPATPTAGETKAGPTSLATAPPPAISSVGATTYVQVCAACHGGNLEGGIGPALRDIGRRRTAAQIAGSIKNPPAGMPKLHPAPVTDRDLVALVAFLQGSGDAPTPTRGR